MGMAIEKVIEKKLDLSRINVSSYISLLLVERVRRGEERVIEEMGREISLKLMNMSDEPRVMNLLSKAEKYCSVLEEEALKIYGGVVAIDAEVSTRLLVHARNPYIPLNIGISWHPYFNLPYIPASSIKGAVRSYAEMREKKEIGGFKLDYLFGRMGEEGMIIFFDSFPIKCSKRLLEADVITPHYKERSNKIKEIDVKPTPIIFPVVATGVVFRIIVGLRKELKRATSDVLQLLKETLTEGLGAKTLVGYGKFRVK